MTTFERYFHGEHPRRPAGDKYLASEDLAGAVNAALAIGRPLLISGEPGTGKTSLGESIAYQLGLEYLRFDTHSDSRWQDCLYSFDALGRLYAAQANDKRGEDPKSFRKLKALGTALTGLTGLEDDEERARILAQPTKKRLVLIDEIDKAPRDFPNGLLAAIEGQRSFHIAETGETLGFRPNPEKNNHPVVVFTTNEERSLPDAFLRRCVFCHIEAPGELRLKQILRAQLESAEQPDALESLSAKAVGKYLTLRKEFGSRMEKQPATAELLDWVRVLIAAGVAPDAVSVAQPHPAALLKTKADRELVLPPKA